MSEQGSPTRLPRGLDFPNLLQILDSLPQGQVEPCRKKRVLYQMGKKPRVSYYKSVEYVELVIDEIYLSVSGRSALIDLSVSPYAD